MSDAAPKDNVHSLVDGHLIRAKQHAANAEGQEKVEMTARQRKIEEWARCADEIIAAKEVAKAEGRKLTHAEIARALGWKVHENNCARVGQLIRWRHEHEVLLDSTPPPYGGEETEKHAQSKARAGVRNHPDEVIAEAKKHPDIARRIRDELDEFLGASETDDPPPDEPATTARSRSAGKRPSMTQEEVTRDFGPDARLNPDGSISMPKGVYEERLAELKADTERTEAEECAEAEAEQREFEEAERARAEHDATPVGRVEKMISRLRFNGAMATGLLPRLTPNLIDQLTPEQRAELLPEIAGLLDGVQKPVEAATAVCRAAMSNSNQ